MRHLPEALTELATDLPCTMNVDEACKVMLISERTFRRLVRKGEFRVIKGGSRVIVTRAEVLRWMAERMTA